MQKHNRHMSFSLYISALAMTDTTALLIGSFELIFVRVHIILENKTIRNTCLNAPT